MRYILALIPPKEVVLTYINAAQQLFAPMQDGYLLSSNHSLPHITICQFECQDEKEAYELWKKIGALKVEPCSIRFTGMSFIKGVGIHQNSYWAELSVARDNHLMAIHRLAVDVLQSQGYTCINDINDLYRPHLTLARIKLLPLIPTWSDSILSNSMGYFRLALARGDENGQYLQTICEFSECIY